MLLSKRSESIQGSVTLAIDAKAKAMRAQGLDVIGFGAGEPDFATPRYIVDAAIRALEEGKTKYTPAAGLPALRQAVCDNIRQRLGVEYTPAQVVISNGAKQSLFNALQAICNPGDEVIVFTPYWVTYPELIKMADAVPVFVPTTADFDLDIPALEHALTARTKAIILNTPSNPTGCVFAEEKLRRVAALAQEHDLILISDEIYDSLVYDGATHFSVTSISPQVQERTILVNGMSKAYAMTGWRIGYAAATEKIAKIMGNIQSHATSNPNTIAQYASIAALTQENPDFASMKQEFQRRRDEMVRLLNEIPGVTAATPRGAFYVFASIEGLLGKSRNGRKLTGSMDFCEALLEAKLTAVVPGLSFGADSYIRLSYATSMENIQKGIPRIREFAEELTND